ncbi:MAG: GTP cyclohydrolase I FolE [Solitalea-like symbiont of Acarus siro]
MQNNNDLSVLTEAYRLLISNIGEDLNREGLIKTPQRAAKSFLYLTRGYNADPTEILQEAIFTADPKKHMIMIESIDIYSLCEHHLLPFFGKAFLAYFPDKKIVGLSKIPRFIEALSSRLQVQETLTIQILNHFQEALAPNGIAVALQCKHLCMSMRGVKQQGSITTTTAFNGVFDSTEHQKSFLSLINK